MVVSGRNEGFSVPQMAVDMWFEKQSIGACRIQKTEMPMRKARTIPYFHRCHLKEGRGDAELRKTDGTLPRKDHTKSPVLSI